MPTYGNSVLSPLMLTPASCYKFTDSLLCKSATSDDQARGQGNLR